MVQSEQIGDLAKALSKFQSEMGVVQFDAVNPFFKSKFASLGQIVLSSKELLGKNGLAVSQLANGESSVTTLLIHESGQYLGDTLTLHPTKNDAQGSGAAITYARRYAYASILGIVSDDDDDGNHASKKVEPAKKTATNVADLKDSLVGVDITKAKVGSIIDEIDLTVKNAKVIEVGKNGKTVFRAMTSDHKEVIIQRWGKTTTDYKDKICTFKVVEVSEFQGDLQFMCKDVVVVG